MANITIDGATMPVRFTAYTAKVMFELTGINLFDQKCLAQIFKDAGTEATPKDFELIAMFIYSSLAAGAMPEGAGVDWKPSFTPSTILNKIHFNDGKLMVEVMAAYLNTTVDELLKNQDENIEVEKKN